MILPRFSLLLLVPVLITVSGCARLHSYQLGDIDARRGELIPIEIKVSEVGINTREGADIAKIFANQEAKKTLDQAEAIIALFQYGPKTGNPVFSAEYSAPLFDELKRQCPTLQFTGLASIRESRKYPVISGEIVRITGYCIQTKRI